MTTRRLRNLPNGNKFAAVVKWLEPVRADQRGETGFRTPGGKPGSPRPPAPAKVLGVLRSAGCPPKGYKGGEAGNTELSQSSQVFGRSLTGRSQRVGRNQRETRHSLEKCIPP